LQRLLAERGIRSTASALGVAMSSQAVAMAPAGLATSVTSAALAAGVSAGAVAATGATASGGFMSMTTLHVGLSGALAVAGAVGYVSQSHSSARLEEEASALRVQNAAIRPLEIENVQLRRVAAEAGELRRDDAELAKLQQEAATLRTRAQEVARAEQARAAKSVTAFEISKLDQTPRAKFQARPEYPVEMRTAGIPGEVVVDFIVDANGDVTNAKAIRSSRAEFESYAVAAVSKWKFAAGKKGGVDVPSRLQVPIVFTLAGQKTVAGDLPKPPSASGAATEPVIQVQPFNVQAK
jgi:TonB family protein